MMKTWSVLCALVIAGLTVVNLVKSVQHTPPPPMPVIGRLPENVVLRQEQRLAGLRRALTARGVRGQVGYIGDLSPPQMGADYRSMEEYFSAQFVLMPCVLDPKLGDSRWAVANLRRTTASERVPADFHVVEDFGDGVLLLQKGAP